MKPSRLNLVAIFLTLAFGVLIAGCVRAGKEEDTTIEAIELVAAECQESETPNDFSEFWTQFRSAVASADKPELFSMTRVCRFDWFVLNRNEELLVPLASADASFPSDPSLTLLNIMTRNSRSWRSGTSVVIETSADFFANFNVIFSDGIRHRILHEEPTSLGDGVFEISWRDDGLRSLRFEHVERKGYKFAGLQWEP